jgi:hypothetical protein
MRRIIERTVTIVTTTILRISWQEDAHPPDQDEFPQPDISSQVVQHTVQRTEQFPPVMEGKEVSLAEIEHLTNQSADIPPHDPYIYQSKKGNEKP